MTTRATATTQVMTAFDAQLKHYAAQSAQMIQGFMVVNNQINALSGKLDAGIDQVNALEDKQEGTSNARLRAKHALLHAPLRA